MRVEKARHVLLLPVIAFIAAACAVKPPEVPYQAFVQAADIPDSFLAGLPGTRAKILSSNPATRRTSMLLALPSEWQFGTGGSPDKTLELYVLQGDVTLGEFRLRPGGYAYLPGGSMGVNMSSKQGALLLYFLDDLDRSAVIQTPIISNSTLLRWEDESDSVENFGIATKQLRYDPGSGARTWLVKIEPGAVQGWQRASRVQEGYLISGRYQHGECVGGVPVAGEYSAGGYFLRPPGAINGGGDASAIETSTWLMRVPGHVAYSRNLFCDVDIAVED